ncbi:MAG: hypothetical protein WCO44_06745 [Bacteroidota bacterium]
MRTSAGIKISLLLFLVTVTLLAGRPLHAQTTKTVGGAGASYATLKLAFDAINAGTITGAITLQVTGSTTETASAVLNASGSGSASYTSVNIYPTLTGKTIGGNIAGPLIDLNGADYVVVDGRVNAAGAAKDMTITNTNTGLASSTVRFINSATNNTLKYCTIRGSEMSSSAGIIFFSTAATGPGNDANLVDQNNITADPAGRPVNAVYSEGTASRENSGNTISNNNIYNFLNNSTASNGISFYSNTTGCTISGNSFYETATFVPTGWVEYDVIRINNVSGVNFNVSDNYIGGSLPSCLGTAWTKTNANNNTFFAIYLNVGTATATSIQNNTIQNINWSNSNATLWTGIHVAAGAVNIGTIAGNTIGSASGTGSITVNAGDNSSSVYGINITGTGTINCQNNIIGSVTAAMADGNKGNNLYGIYKNPGAGTTNISNNTIGSAATAGSFQASSTSMGNGQTVIGINSDGTGTTTISGNILINIKNGQTSFTGSSPTIGIQTTAGSNTIQNNTVGNISTGNGLWGSVGSASAMGICQKSTTSGTLQSVNGNVVYNITNNHPNRLVRTNGIFYQGPPSGANTVSGNFVHDLSLSSSDPGSDMDGIVLYDGLTTCANNVISLGTGITGGYAINGIWDNSGSTNNNSIWFNTVNIGGSVSPGTTTVTAALYNPASSSTRNYRDNILNNTRSGGSSGKHYAIYLSGTSGLTIDYNDYFANGTSGVLGFVGSDKTTLAAFSAATGQDAGSSALNPAFVNAGGASATDYEPTCDKLAGITISAVTVDYLSAPRAATPTMGAFEGTLNLNIDVYKAGVLQASYLRLKDVFDKINNGTLTGGLEVRIKASLIENASAVLYQNGYTGSGGTSNYSAVTIYPTLTGLSVTGDFTAPLIDFNGAVNVTVDGRVNQSGSAKDLILTNINTGTPATIRFINSAGNNTVKYCYIKGSELITAGGIIFFSTAPAGNGNDNITIDQNTITAESTGRPVNAVYSEGTASHENSGIIISNNILYNFMNPALASNGIFFNSNTTGCNITANNFFETTTIIPTNSSTYNIIQINNIAGSGFVVSDNYIGGGTIQCGGTAWTKTGSNNTFYGIYMNAGTSAATSIQNNTIRNFSWNNAYSYGWTGIHIAAGWVNIGTVAGNTIGAGTGTGSIAFTAGETSSNVYGINIAGTGVVDCENNIIGAISATVTDGSKGNNVYGISKAGVAGNTIISNNLIGSLVTPNSIQALSTSTGNSQTMTGISCDGTATNTISGNTVMNIRSAQTSFTGTSPVTGIQTTAGSNTIQNNTTARITSANAYYGSPGISSVCGIAQKSNTGGTTQTVTGNSVYEISNANTNSHVRVTGILYQGPSSGSNTVSGNFVVNLTLSSTDAGAGIEGIGLYGGPVSCFNNIVSLGTGVTTGYSISGIWDNGGPGICNLWFNTVYTGGAISSGSTSSTAAIYSASGSSTRNYRDNLLYNGRTGGTSGKHYALWLAGTTSLTIDYNDYYVTGTNGILAYINGDKTTLADLKAATGQDAGSISTNPLLSNPGGTTATDYIPAAILPGTTISGVPADYSGYTRAATPTIGAYERTLNIDVYKAGVFQATYARLKDAFDKINNGTHTGSLEIKIRASTTEPATAALYQSGYTGSGGTSSYTSVSIYPAVNGISITGNLAAPLIDLNGAVNVTIDGCVNATGSSRSMVVSNTSSSNAAGTATIRLINDASSNTIKYCILKGSTTNTSSGVVAIATTSGTTGNNANSIDNNNITNASDASRPLAAIFSSGTPAKDNTGNSYTNNNIFDVLNRSAASGCINIGAYSTAETIQGNSFYETSPFVPAAGVSYSLVKINNTSGNGYLLSGNYFGGNAAQCGGSPWTKTAAADNGFYAINLTVGATTASSVQGNVIRNFAWSNQGAAAWTALQVSSGVVNIGTVTGNTIGASAGTGSIIVTGGASGTAVYGMNIAGAGTIVCQNNTIGAITADNTDATAASSVYAISRSNTATSTFSNNLIGSTSAANSIQAVSVASANAQNVYGLYNTTGGTFIVSNCTIANLTNSTTNANSATFGVVNGIASSYGVNTIIGNTIRNLTNANANNSAANTASVCGIALTSTNTLNTITGNTIYALVNTNTTFSGSVAGLYFGTTGSSHIVAGNFIHSLSVTGVSSSASLYGIKIGAGAATYYNNIINLGGNTAATIYGIYETGTTGNNNNLYFNSVYIGGAPVTGALNSYALYSAVSTNTRNFRDNIIENARSDNGSTGQNYCAYFNYGVNTNLTLDFNDYYAPGTGGVLGSYNGTDVTTLPLITGKDASSLSLNPLFANAGGTNPADYYPASDKLAGTAISSITTDYNSLTRSGTPTMGAIEGNLNLNVSVYKAGLLQARYTSLKYAFDRIDDGTHTGALEIRITGNTTEPSSAMLFQSGYTSAGNTSSYSSVLIYPTVSGCTISGNLDAPLIDLYGADNVTIDGRVNATGAAADLTLANSSTGSSSSNGTLRFYNSAENNLIRYCNIQGSCTSAATGMINFSSASSGNGNDNDIIEFCNITNAGGNRPVNTLFANGTASHENSGDIIRNNNFFNFINPAISSYGMNIASNATGWTISGNSFYETTVVIPSAATNYNVIRVMTGDGHMISGNYIGGSASHCGGTAWTVNSNTPHYFCGIYTGSATGTTNTVQNNLIQNISYTSIQANPWDGIFVYSGNVNVIGNTIGATTGTGSIVVSTPAAAASATVTGGVVTALTLIGGGSGYTTPPVITFSTSGSTTPATATATITGGVVTAINLTGGGSGYTGVPSVVFDGQTNGYSTSHGMIQNSAGTVNITGNNIGSITTVGSAWYSHGFESIYVRGIVANTTFTNNLIGSLTTPNSIFVSSAASASLTKQDVYGIYSSGIGTTVITGNTIANLTNAYTGLNSLSRTRGIATIAGSNTITNNTVRNLTTSSKQSSNASSASVIGISQTSATASTTQAVTGNTVYSLSDNSPTAQVYVTGIYYTGPATGTFTVSGNFIYSLSVASADLTSSLRGIDLNNGNVACYDNIVNLGTDVAIGCKINGIWEESTAATYTKSILFNSVYIGGTIVSGTTSSTCALWNQSNNATRDYRNNILFNARTGGSTGKHYAVYLSGTAGLTIDYNDYYVTGSNGMLGYLVSDKASLALWKTATGQDANSLNINPGYTVAGGTSPGNYYTSGILPGVAGTGVTIDFTGLTRNPAPKMGALERNLVTWKGSTSTDFGTAANWTENEVPATGVNITFDNSPVNNCILDQNRTVGDIINAQSLKILVINGKQLTITGNLNFTNGAQIDASASTSTVGFAGLSSQVIPAGSFVNNSIYNLALNNPYNVALSGTLRVLNSLTATNGKLDAKSTQPSMVFAGVSGQSIAGNLFLNDSVYNLTVDNTSGVTLNANLTVINSLVINTGKLLAIGAARELTVTGTLTNNAGTAGLLLLSDSTGTASLLHNNANVPATVQRYISGSKEAWHFLSPPVSNQDISANQGTAGSWLPSGSYGNGTGYDLYIWNEPTNCWIYKLNTTATVNWNTIHPGADFVPGRGYLYSVQALHPTKTFTGTLNNGPVSYGFSSGSSDPALVGFNLVGNPYPSAIDWSAATGWTRTGLMNSAGGYDMWIWNPAANNYGVFNSNDGDGVGTNAASRYIAPMQGFFVRAAATGALGFDNPVRIPTNAPWFKTTSQEINKVNLIVQSGGGNGTDEILLNFNYTENVNGAKKLFSEVATAPSLYMANLSEQLSVRNFTNTGENPSVPVYFKPGTDGNFTISCSFDPGKFDVVMLQDLQKHYVQNLKTNNNYSFESSTSDSPTRFILHFGPDNSAYNDELPARIYADGHFLVIDLSLIACETEGWVYDAQGRLLIHRMLSGKTLHSVDLVAGAQMVIVIIRNPNGHLSRKIIWPGTKR